MGKILRWAIWLPIVLFVIAFAIANRQSVTLSLNPFNADSAYTSREMPLWLLFFFGIFAGVIIGWIGCWFAQAKHRKRAREAQAEVARLQAEALRFAAQGQGETPQQALVPSITPMGPGWV